MDVRMQLGRIGMALATLALPAASPSAKRNVLVILTDQQTADALSAAGNPHLKTPAMDSLAARGVRFTRAYSPNPLCVPARCSLFTGMDTHTLGVTINDLDATWDTQAYPYLATAFQKAGFDTGYIGKWHLTTSPEATGVHGFDFVRHARENALDPDVPAACEAFLTQKHDRPFLMVASFVNPHDICEWARDGRLPNGPMEAAPAPELCPPLPANFAIPALEPEVLRQVQPMAPKTYPTVGWTPERWRQYRWTYYRLVERVDTLIGQVLSTLKRTGHETDTTIVFTSDHGDGMGSHRWNQKQVLYEEVAKVPFLVAGPGVARPGRTDATLVNIGTDLFPTLMDVAGVPRPSHLPGLSLKPVVAAKAPLKRDHVVIETEFCQSKKRFGIAGRAVLTARYKYVVYDKGAHREQLFDLAKDPGEMVNLAETPTHASTKRRLRGMLEAWMKRTKDDFKG